MGHLISSKTAAFIDKDGTIVHDVPYNSDPRRIRFIDGALEGLHALQKAGFALVLITNQAGIGHRYFSEREFSAYMSAFEEMLGQAGVTLDSVEYCPHHPLASDRRYRRVCACRKPNPGMLVRAAGRAGYTLASSWMIGDTGDDVEAGHRAGCKSVLVGEGDAIPSRSPIRIPESRCLDLCQAADVVIRARALDSAREHALA